MFYCFEKNISKSELKNLKIFNFEKMIKNILRYDLNDYRIEKLINLLKRLTLIQL